MMFKTLNYIHLCNYFHDEVLDGGFLLVDYEAVFEDNDDDVEDGWDDFQFLEMGSLGNLVDSNEWSLIWIWVIHFVSG